MSYFGSTEFFQQVAEGLWDEYSIVNKFGAGDATTTLAEVCRSGTYQMPKTIQALEFISSSALDTSTGTGAQQITYQGLDANWEVVTGTVATNGTTAVALPDSLIRLFRWYVSKSGTYGTAKTSSHFGTLTIRASGAGATWSQIELVGSFGLGQSEIGWYTVPAGKTAYMWRGAVTTDSSKQLNAYFFQRPNANDVSATYNGTMRIVNKKIGIENFFVNEMILPGGPLVGPCDVGVSAMTSLSTAHVECSFSLLLKDT